MAHNQQWQILVQKLSDIEKLLPKSRLRSPSLSFTRGYKNFSSQLPCFYPDFNFYGSIFIRIGW